jgi:hypothetical protein
VAVDIAAPARTFAGNSAISVTASARSAYAPSQLNWRWTQTSGTAAQLADADAATLRVTLPALRTTIGLRVTVTDPLGGQTIDDTTIEVNNPPLSAAAGPIFARPGEALAHSLIATDPDGDPVRYTLLRGPEGMTIGRDDGRLQWLADGGGSQVVRVAIEDVHGLRGKDLELQVEVGEGDRSSAVSPLGSRRSGGGGAFGWAGLALLGLALASLRLQRRQIPPGM